MEAYMAERVAAAVEAGEIKEWPWMYRKAVCDGRPFAVIKADCLTDMVEAAAMLEYYTMDFSLEEISKEEYEALEKDADVKAYAEELYAQPKELSEEDLKALEEEANDYAEFDTAEKPFGMYVRKWDKDNDTWGESLLVSVAVNTEKDAWDQAAVFQDKAQTPYVDYFVRELTEEQYEEALKTVKKLEVQNVISNFVIN